MQVKNAKFVTSAQNISQCPAPACSEIAFLGRSNVGKSSILNFILGKNLAKSSATPGKTQLINFFSVDFENLDSQNCAQSLHANKLGDDENSRAENCERVQNFGQLSESGVQISKIPLTFIDLPGFGYAKVSKELKARWERDLLEFLQKRSSIKLFIHLRDSRHPNLSQDDEVLAFLQNLKRGDQQILTIFTKADKLKKNELNALFSKGALLVSTQNTSNKICDVQNLRAKILKATFGE